MTETFCRVTLRKATFSGPVFDMTTCSGYLVEFEPGAPPTPEILRRVDPDEPDPEIEVGYSQDVLEPLTLVHKNRKEHLSHTLFVFFRYLYDLYRTKGQTEFTFTEICIAFRERQVKMTNASITQNIKRLKIPLDRLNAGVFITYEYEMVYVRDKIVLHSEYKNVPEKLSTNFNNQ